MVKVIDKGMRTYTYEARTVEIGGELFQAEELLKVLNGYYQEECIYCYPDSRFGMALKTAGLFTDENVVMQGDIPTVNKYNKKVLRELIRQIGDIVG